MAAEAYRHKLLRYVDEIFFPLKSLLLYEGTCVQIQNINLYLSWNLTITKQTRNISLQIYKKLIYTLNISLTFIMYA